MRVNASILPRCPSLSALAEIEQLLERQRGSAGTVIRVSLGTITLHTEPCAHRQLDALALSTDIHHRRLFATDAPGQSEIFRSLSTRDLGIAIGAVDPNASIAVGDINGVTSIVDAVVTLRYFAFGMNDVHEETAARRDVDRLKLNALDDLEQAPSRADAGSDAPPAAIVWHELAFQRVIGPG